MIKLISTIFISTFFVAQNQAQIKVDNLATGEHCLILAEEDKISISGVKSNFIYILLSKRVKVQILDNEGVRLYERLAIPELHDSKVPSQAPIINNIEPELPSSRIIEFKYWINGKQELNPKAISTELVRAENLRFVVSDLFSFEIKDLKVGDVLQYSYSVELPYDNNWQRFFGYRTFFHGPHPKKDYEFSLSLPKKLPHQLYFINNPVYEKTEIDNQIVISVKMKDLPGCTDESGARLHSELPYLSFYPQPYEWLYVPYNHQLGKFMPFHIAAARSREIKSYEIFKRFDTGTNNPDMNAARKFIKNFSVDTAAGMPLKNAHNQIVRDFSFLPDRDYLAEYDTRKSRIGEHMLSKQLRNINRFDTYRYLLTGLNMNFNTVYPCDIRAGSIGSHYLWPVLSNDYLFVTNMGSKTALIYPKKSRGGYYLDELPFYFEGTDALRITMDDVFIGRSDGFSNQLDMIRLPKSSASDNMRRINSMVELSEKGECQFNSKVLLSGQFSTNGRHVYRKEKGDHTINPLYYHTPYSIPSTISGLEIDINKEETTPPFTFDCNARFNSKIATLKGDDLLIDLSQMFPHIVEQIMPKEPRQLSYYTDFIGTDLINCMIKLPVPYELLDSPKFEIINSYGKFVFEVSLNTPNQLLIRSAHIIETEKVEAQKIHDVIDIQSAIIEVNASKIHLKKITDYSAE
jgi:hypothetical protein